MVFSDKRQKAVDPSYPESARKETSWILPQPLDFWSFYCRGRCCPSVDKLLPCFWGQGSKMASAREVDGSVNTKALMELCLEALPVFPSSLVCFFSWREWAWRGESIRSPMNKPLLRKALEINSLSHFQRIIPLPAWAVAWASWSNHLHLPSCRQALRRGRGVWGPKYTPARDTSSCSETPPPPACCLFQILLSERLCQRDRGGHSVSLHPVLHRIIVYSSVAGLDGWHFIRECMLRSPCCMCKLFCV